jgi:DNA-binding transcriptional ArsR family regulator
MRGTSKREDAAFWVIRIDEVKGPQEHEKGALFETVFVKTTQLRVREWTREWTFKTGSDGQVSIGCQEISFDKKVFQLIETGVRSATEIAKELGVAPSTISKAASRLEQKKLIERRGGNRYTTYEVRGVVKE